MTRPTALPIQQRSHALLPISVDAESRTMEVTWTTGSAAPRVRWEGWEVAVPFVEELLVTDSAIDMTRLNAGAPVLESHNSSSTAHQVAVVERAWIDNGEGKALLRFPLLGTDDKSDRLFSLIQQGIVRNLSVGYRLDRVRVVPAKGDKPERHIVERWTPHEISFVTVPADAGAQVRSAGELQPVQIVQEANNAAAARARMRMRLPPG